MAATRSRSSAVVFIAFIAIVSGRAGEVEGMYSALSKKHVMVNHTW